MISTSDYLGLAPTWCPGCGNFGILEAFKRALVDLAIAPHQLLMVSGIGQAGKLPHYTKGNIFNSLHGRAIPVAIGAKIANTRLTVIVIGGDGDGYGEGGNHLLHASRRNHDLTYLIHNNQVYGLTKGQASPTSDQGFITKTTPYGSPQPLNPVLLAIASGASFVGRGYAGDSDHLSQLIKQGITHQGFSVIDILQPCVSFNPLNTYQWYQQRVYKLDDVSYSPINKQAAFTKAQEWHEGIPIGIIFKEDRPTYEEQFPALKNEPLVKQLIEPKMAGELLNAFR
jgi:2-oxoglutarate ferredoxin oxidoreductase subunit beta